MNPEPLATGPALWSFVAYLVLVVAIGVWASRFSSSGMSAYFLAGRGLNRWVVALSAVVSGRSSWLLLGMTGMAYAQGLSALWAAVGYVVVEFLLFWDYAGRLRRFSEARDCITLPDFFAARFADRGALRVLIVLVFLIFLPTYVGAQFAGGGKAFATAFGMSQASGLWLTAGIVLVYTVLGGFLAVSLTDMLQAFFMVFALVVLPIVALTSAGGWGAVAEALDPALLDPFSLGTGALIGYVGIGLGSPGNPHILVRYMAIDDPAQLRASAVVSTVWNAVMAFGAVLTGIVGRALIPNVDALPDGDKENLYATLAANELHPVLFGVVLASIFAAIMSTTDSQLLVAASSVVRDLYEKLLRKGRPVDQRKLVRLSRIVVVLLVLISAALGLVGGSVVFWFVLLAWAGLGAALGPTSILALYWSRTTRAGTIAGVLVGGTTAALWRVYRAELGGLYELIPAFAAGLVATIAVSLVTRPPEDAETMFDEMRD